MNKTIKEQILRLADKADNCIAASQLPMPAVMHVEGLKGALEDISKKLREIVAHRQS